MACIHKYISFQKLYNEICYVSNFVSVTIFRGSELLYSALLRSPTSTGGIKFLSTHVLHVKCHRAAIQSTWDHNTCTRV
jgi:hypothetical protein